MIPTSCWAPSTRSGASEASRRARRAVRREEHEPDSRTSALAGATLLLAARELRRLSFPRSRSAAPARARGQLAPDLRLRSLGAPQPEQNVVEHVEVRKARSSGRPCSVPMRWRAVGDVGFVEEDPALGRSLEARDEAKRRGLSAARGTEQREELASRDLEVERVDGGYVAKRLVRSTSRISPRAISDLEPEGSSHPRTALPSSEEAPGDVGEDEAEQRDHHHDRRDRVRRRQRRRTRRTVDPDRHGVRGAAARRPLADDEVVG